MAVAAVIFDLDGTLLDTLADLGGCMNRVLDRLGYPTHPLDRYRRFVGDGIEVLARRCLAGVTEEEAAVSQVVEAMRREYGQRWAESTQPYEGVPELLRDLAARRLPLAVLSNKPHDFTVRMVDHFFPQQPFFAVWGARPQYPRKPSPKAALALAAAMRVAPGDVLYLGDTDTDMRTAVAARMFPVGVAWGFRPASELVAAGARRVVGSPTGVLDLVAADGKTGRARRGG